jgi:hypothetical protein
MEASSFELSKNPRFTCKNISVSKGDDKKRVHVLCLEQEDSDHPTQWFISTEIATVILELAPSYVRRRLNEEPLKDLLQCATRGEDVLKLIATFNPLGNPPKHVNLLPKETVRSLVNLLGRERRLPLQFLIAIDREDDENESTDDQPVVLAKRKRGLKPIPDEEVSPKRNTVNTSEASSILDVLKR